jgi:nucleoside-diphosphate-sugar epimerase
MSSKGKIVVLGVNGHIGHAVAEAFVKAGWDVTGMARSDKGKIPGVRYVAGNSDSVDDMRRAIGDAEIVVNALNMPYDKWFNGRKEAMMARVLEAMGKSGKTMLFPGTIYNYAADSDVLTPDLPQNPPTPRGAIRVRIEKMFEDAAERGDIQVIILRAGDFYGPATKMDWFDQLIMSNIKGRRLWLLGTRGIGHSWAYLPDLSRAFEALASVRSTLGAFERFHFAGNHVTYEQMAAAIQKASPVKLAVSRMPFIVLQAWGLFDPVIREIAKMRYIWQNPLKLTDPRLDALLGPDFHTPFERAVATTVKPFFQNAGLESKSSANVLSTLA